MTEMLNDDLDELPEYLFFQTLSEIAKKPGNKYDFIVKAGDSLVSALLNLFKVVWRTEKVPSKWHESRIIPVYKQKNSINDLVNYRHLHDKDPLGKFFGKIVISLAKEKIFHNMSKYQVACRPGHRASEILYVIKSVLAAEKTKK